MTQRVTDEQAREVIRGYGYSINVIVLAKDLLDARSALAEREAECAALRAQAKLPENYCLACGGDGGHTEGCNGTTGLLALYQELAGVREERDTLRAEVERLRGALEHIQRRCAYAIAGPAVHCFAIARDALSAPAPPEPACERCHGTGRECVPANDEDEVMFIPCCCRAGEGGAE